MIDLLSLIKTTSAYKIISQDKKAGRLSHAYLVVCSDQKFLNEYLKILSKLIMCKTSAPCNECRACKLIDSDSYFDVKVFPKNGQSVMVDDVASLVEESFIKPLEDDKRLFVISNGQTMNPSSQNKLLKTLEEPPKNVHILIGTTSEFAILPTVKSRVKKLSIDAFSKDVLFECLKEECVDHEKLKVAISCGDGTLGLTHSLYLDDGLKQTMDLACDILLNMRSSSDVLEFSNKIVKSKIDFSQLVNVLELLLRDLLCTRLGATQVVYNSKALSQLKDEKRLNQGAIVYVLDKLIEAKMRKKFNANQTMLIEWLLFTILEGEYKWQKL